MLRILVIERRNLFLKDIYNVFIHGSQSLVIALGVAARFINQLGWDRIHQRIGVLF